MLNNSPIKLSVLSLLVSMCLLLCCEQDDDFGTIDDNEEIVIPFRFADGYESMNNDFNELFAADGNRWTNIQLVHPNNGENSLELNTNAVSEGDYALKVVAKASDDILSKADIEKQGFSAPIGSTITIEAKFFIEGENDLKDLFLLDLECCACWDPSVPNNQCPGIRLKMNDNNHLSIERGKILGTTLSQTAVSFPQNEWVDVKWTMTLHPNESGENRLTINGAEVINAMGKNMPNPDELRDAAAAEGIAFELQEPLVYERIQIGATANPTPQEVILYVDDVKITIE